MKTDGGLTPRKSLVALWDCLSYQLGAVLSWILGTRAALQSHSVFLQEIRLMIKRGSISMCWRATYNCENRSSIVAKHLLWLWPCQGWLLWQPETVTMACCCSALFEGREGIEVGYASCCLLKWALRRKRRRRGRRRKEKALPANEDQSVRLVCGEVTGRQEIWKQWHSKGLREEWLLLVGRGRRVKCFLVEVNYSCGSVD